MGARPKEKMKKQKNKITGRATDKTTKPWRQLYADEHDELFKLLLKDRLLLAVFVLCAIRARRVKKVSPEGLSQFEFFLSELEFNKFGLKKAQKGQVRRRLLKLIRLGLVSKAEKKIGSKKSNVYAFTSDKIIFINPETETTTETKQRADREQTETNKNDKKDKKVKNIPPNPPKEEPHGESKKDGPTANQLANLEARNLQEIFEHYKKESGEKTTRLIPERKAKIKARLKTFKVREVKVAITNCFKDSFYNGDDGGWRANIDYIFRDDERLEKFSLLKPRTKNVIYEPKYMKGVKNNE